MAILLLFLTLGHLASGRMHFSFFPPVEADFLAAWLTMPQGTPFEVTEAAVRRLEASVEELRAELDPEFAAADESLVLHVLASVGSQPFRDRQSRTPTGGPQQASDDSHLGEVVLELVPSEERAIEHRARWRSAGGASSGASPTRWSWSSRRTSSRPGRRSTSSSRGPTSGRCETRRAG